MDKQKRTRITSIKVRRGVWSFAWEEKREEASGWDKHTLVCGDEPRVELLEGLRAMARYAAEICEMGAEAEKAVFVDGIKMSYTLGNSYLVLLAQKALLACGALWQFRTPVWPEHPENGSDFCMSPDLVHDLRVLMTEAWRYIHGERAQQTLPFAKECAAEDTNDTDTEDADTEAHRQSSGRRKAG